MVKQIKILIIPILLLLSSSASFADAFIVKISYTEGEKSKDSWSMETVISIDGNDVAYSRSYSGSQRSKKKDETKTCTLSDEAAGRIQKMLSDNKMFVNDSLFDRSDKFKMYEEFVNISINVAYAESIGRIRVNGDLAEIGEGDLYKRSVVFINSVLDEIDKCK